MRLVWAVIPLVLLGIIGVSESFAEDYLYNYGKFEILRQGADIDSPKAQFESGAERHEIICRGGLYLLYKTSDGSPACVEEYFSAPKLIDRGWATLGETSLVITTDKEAYSLGEKISIMVKNEGETMLMYSGPVRFFILDEFENYVEYPTDTTVPNKENISFFDTLSSLSFVWDQTTVFYEGSIKPGTYTISTKYMQPLPSNDLIQLNHQWVETTKTFEIIGSANVVITTDKPIYKIGEKITIKMENLGTADAQYAGIPVGFWVTDEEGNMVLQTQGIFEARGWLKTGEPIIYEWDPIDPLTKNPVEPGVFTITTHWDATKESSHSFTITE